MHSCVCTVFHDLFTQNLHDITCMGVIYGLHIDTKLQYIGNN